MEVSRFAREEREERLKPQVTIVPGVLEESSSEYKRLADALSRRDTAHIAVVADVLRCTTTIHYLLVVGAHPVIVSPDKPSLVRDYVEFRNRSRGGDHVIGMGSDSDGLVRFRIGNSPYEVMQRREEVVGHVPVISTSKGSRALVNAHNCGFDHVIAGGFPTAHALQRFVEAHDVSHVYVIATEGQHAENAEETEDWHFGQYIKKLLENDEQPDHVVYADTVASCYGASRFFKGIPYFPPQDVELAVARPDTMPFVPTLHVQHGLHYVKPTYI